MSVVSAADSPRKPCHGAATMFSHLVMLVGVSLIKTGAPHTDLENDTGDGCE